MGLFLKVYVKHLAPRIDTKMTPAAKFEQSQKSSTGNASWKISGPCGFRQKEKRFSFIFQCKRCETFSAAFNDPRNII